MRHDGWTRRELGKDNFVVRGALLRGVDFEKRVQGSEAAADVAIAIVNQIGSDEIIAGGSLSREAVATRREALRSVADRLGILPVVNALYNQPVAPGEARRFEPPPEITRDVEAAAVQGAILSSAHGGPVYVEMPGSNFPIEIPKGGSSFLHHAIRAFRKTQKP